MWKLFSVSGVLVEKMYSHLETENLLPGEQIKGQRMEVSALISVTYPV